MTDVRVKPCAFCPYRRDVPSGVWAAAEYECLRRYDGSIAEQAMAGATRPFSCHSSPDSLCAGWVGHRDHPADLLAVRIGMHRDVDPAVLDYTTDVPLWPSGAAAADHGQRDIAAPADRAAAAIDKLIRAHPGHWRFTDRPDSSPTAQEEP